MTIKELEQFMFELAIKHARVHIIDFEGIEYTGVASSYTRADDEENGFATFYVDFDEIRHLTFGSGESTTVGGLVLASNEIVELEEI